MRSGAGSWSPNLLGVNPRTRLVLVAIAALSLSGAVLAATVGRSEDDSSGPAAIVEDLDANGPHSPFKGAVRPKVPPADFALRDQDGVLVRLADLRGKVVVLSPMYTTCQDTCPLVAQQIRGALDDLPRSARRGVRALAVSVDPNNDSPRTARRFLATRRVRAYLDFLLGSWQALQPVWKAYGFARQTEAREHNSYVVLIDKLGRQRVGFPVNYLTPEALAHDIAALLREPDRRRSGA
jgi:protein SCO1